MGDFDLKSFLGGLHVYLGKLRHQASSIQDREVTENLSGKVA
jgi:hypothetical protein